MSTTSTSLTQRLTHTPMRDLVRGRITGRLDLDAKLAQANLTPDAAALVKQTVRRTRLWRLEKIAVADELIAHFRDAAEARPPVDGAAAVFGDTATAAKLIRRAKLRLRHPLWHVWRWFRLGVGVLILFYALVTALFYSGSPTVASDYLDELNAAARALPENDRAWPIYRDAWLDQQQFSGGLPFQTWIDGRNVTIRPGDADWPRVARKLEQGQPYLDALRRGAKKQGLGFEIKPRSQLAPRDRRVLFPGYPAKPRSKDPAILSAQESLIRMADRPGHYGYHFVRASQILLTDTDLAIQERDPSRSIENLASLLGLHRQILNAPLASRYSVQIFEHACHKAQDILIEQPSVWSDEDLNLLADHFRGAAVSPEHTNRPVRFLLLDLIQRIYTDNRRGNGRITPQGLQILNYLSSHGKPRDDEWLHGGPEGYWAIKSGAYATLPKALFTTPSRREAMEFLDTMFPAVAPVSREPLWKLVQAPAEPSLANHYFRQRKKFAFLQPWVSRGSLGLNHIERLEAAREGVRIGLALEQYRRRHGDWPEVLDDITPHYGEDLPFDRITGGTLRYRITDDGPLVYSVGADRDDDQGVLPKGRPGSPPDRSIAAAWHPVTDDPRYDGDWVLYPSTSRMRRP